MTDVNLLTPGADSSHLTTLRVAELQALALELRIPGASKLRKGELVGAITAAQARNASSGDSAADTATVAVAADASAVDAPASAPVEENTPAAENADVAVDAPRKRVSRRASTST
ncbi:MAG TPA: Rho termination factor N-terminal domain-containing protein, partial [Cryobacterium sp.]|nr:Rho termination factor N-terminal domain-containing protein [Cryobacterium sp.]